MIQLTKAAIFIKTQHKIPASGMQRGVSKVLIYFFFHIFIFASQRCQVHFVPYSWNEAKLVTCKGVIVFSLELVGSVILKNSNYGTGFIDISINLGIPSEMQDCFSTKILKASI